MDVTALSQAVTTVGPVDCLTADRAILVPVLESIRRVRAWADRTEIEVAQRLAQVSPHAASELAAAARRSPRHGATTLALGATVAAVPALRAPLASGEFDGSHVGAFAGALRGLTDEERAALVDRSPALVSEGASGGWSADTFADRLRTCPLTPGRTPPAHAPGRAPRPDGRRPFETVVWVPAPERTLRPGKVAARLCA